MTYTQARRKAARLTRAGVPTMVIVNGSRAGGYQTHYRGKWHVSHADLTIAGTHEGLMTSDDVRAHRNAAIAK